MELFLKLLAIVETCGLVFGLFFAAKGIKAKKEDPSRKGYLRRAGIYIGIYLVLNALRNFVF